MTAAVGFLISGRGSNMIALLDAIEGGGIPAHPALVLSHRPDVPGLAHAAERGVPTAVVDHRAYRGDREAFEAALQAAFDVHGVDLLCFAGFLRILTATFVERWRGRALNIHPSLLPLFKGLHTHERALADGVAIHGCTVHEVVPDLDSGPILGQAAVPVLPGDTPDTLADRVLRAEHALYPAVLAAFLSDRETLRRAPLAHLHPEPPPED